MGPFESSHQHGPPLLGRVRGANPFPDVLARMQPSDSLPPVGRGSGRPWPVAYPVPRATRRKKGLPGAWAVLFQRAVGSDPAGCASRLAHRVETAIAFRLHNALGTPNERYFVAVNPTAHSLACLRIGVFVTAVAARLATGVGGSPFTGRVSYPLDGEQSFMTSPHRHSPLTSLAWSHRAPTPRRTLIVLPHLDTPPARTLSQSSVQENPRAQDLVHAQIVIEAWRREYNEDRPKKGLGGLTPAH